MRRFLTILLPLKNSLVNSLLLIFIVVSVIIIQPLKSSAQVTINGSLETIGEQNVLNLWGTNYEMGYAHGYLMASQIRNLVDNFALGRLAGGNVTNYNNFLAEQAQFITHYPQYLDEINGIAAGIVASGKNLYVPRLGRNIDVRDIKALNLTPELSMYCGSFGVWGNATANGETILGRNLEFPYDSQGSLVNNQLLITYEPTGGTKFVNFSFPGIIGIASGLNENGVSLMINQGNTGTATGTGPFYPSLEVLRRILETTTTANYLTQPLSIVNSVQEFTPFIIQIGTPHNESGNDPVYYLEDSSGPNVIRYAADTNPGYNHIIASNHFLKVSSPPPTSDSLHDYNLMEGDLFYFYANGDGKVDALEAWYILDRVAGYDTLTSIVIRPDTMEFYVSHAELINGSLTLAPRFQPQTYLWSTLFPNHGPTPPPVALPDLFIQSIATNPMFPGPGQPVDVTVTVKNQGTVTAGAFSLDFYKNLASAPTINQTGDAYCIKNDLAAGVTASCTFTVTYPATGSYGMWAQADGLQQVEEINETNNILGPQTISIANPDLAVTSLTAPSTANACQIVTVNDSTRNIGSSTAGSSATKLYWSTSSSYNSGAIYLGSRQVGSLAAGATSSGSTSVTIPCGAAPGTYYIVARADADGTVPESNETNNDRSVAITITVGGPDLVISSLSAPSLARRCQTITVKSTTKNTGSSAAGSSATNIYYSTSSTYSSGAVFIGSRIISQLAAGASSSGDLSIQVPCGMSPGRYYLIVRADADNALVETNENNNSLSKSIYIFR